MTDAERRRAENAEIIRKMRAGESLAMVDTRATWWPPRPKIEKDKALIARVLGEQKP